MVNRWRGSSVSLLNVIERGSILNEEIHKTFLANYNAKDVVCFFEAVRFEVWGIPVMYVSINRISSIRLRTC